MEEIAAEITADADLQAAYNDLKHALADPAMRDTVNKCIARVRAGGTPTGESTVRAAKGKTLR